MLRVQTFWTLLASTSRTCTITPLNLKGLAASFPMGLGRVSSGLKHLRLNPCSLLGLPQTVRAWATPIPTILEKLEETGVTQV